MNSPRRSTSTEDMKRMDPFELVRFILGNENIYERAIDPKFWIRLYDQVFPDASTMSSQEYGRLVMPGNPQRINEVPLPIMQQILMPGETLADIDPDSSNPAARSMARKRIFAAYFRAYTKAWVLSRYPDRKLKLGDMSSRYKWLIDWWYMSDKGFTMHSFIKDQYKLIVPYWDPRRIGQEEFHSSLARIDYLPWDSSTRTGDTYKAITLNAQTLHLEEAPVPQVVPGIPYTPRRSDPQDVNIMTMRVPNTAYQLMELTAYRNHDFTSHFGGRGGNVTAWDVVRVLFSPGDLEMFHITAWNDEPIPPKAIPYILSRSTDVQQYIDDLKAEIMGRVQGNRDIIRIMASEMAAMLSILNSS